MKQTHIITHIGCLTLRKISTAQKERKSTNLIEASSKFLSLRNLTACVGDMENRAATSDKISFQRYPGNYRIQ